MKPYLKILILFIFIFFDELVYCEIIKIDKNWLEKRGAGPYYLDKSNTTYILETDVTTEGTAFLIGSPAGPAKNIIFDLNGHTITYADMEFNGIENPGFEEGDPLDPRIPLGWDLSGAYGHAFRQDYKKKLFFGNYSLRIENIAGDPYPEVYVTSSPVYLPKPGRYAIIAQVQGGPHGVLDAKVCPEGVSVACTNHVSKMHLNYIGDMPWGLICEFNINQPTVVKAKIIVGTKDDTKTTYLNVDEVDIRPIDDLSSPRLLGMAAFKPYSWNSSMTEIKNGKIIQGKSKAIYSSAIKYTNAKKIHDLTIITNGINCQNIDEEWNGDIEIYNNYLEANGKFPLNRHYFFSMINLGRTLGGNKIYNNILINGPHVGIYHGNAKGGVINPKKSEIYKNIIKTRITATNGFAIIAGSNLEIYDNLIEPIQGHGIGLGRYSDEVKIFNNIIKPKTWPCSEYSAYHYPNPAHGIRIKNYGSGTISNLEIFNNLIMGETNPQHPNCYTQIVGITNYLEEDKKGRGVSKNVRIYNNTVSVKTDNYLQHHAIAYKAQGQGEVFNNTFKSNHIIVEMSDFDTGGVSQYKKFYSNTLVKGDNPQGFYTLRYSYLTPRDNTFIDTKLQNGADLKDISFGINNSGVSYPNNVNLTVSWYLNINLKDQFGNPVRDAKIEVMDKNNNMIDQFVTDADGNVKAELREYVFTYKDKKSNGYHYYSPYQIKIIYEGSEIFSKKFNINKSMNLNIRWNQDSNHIEIEYK